MSANRSIRLAAVLLASFGMLCASASHASLAGRWRIEGMDGRTEFVVIEQVGGHVTFTYDGIAFSGDVAGGRLGAYGNGRADFRCDGAIVAAVRDKERRLYGTLFDFGIICFGPFQGSIVGERCECFDGNLADGDGCDARCHVEPCFSCSDDSSLCVPTGDGGACDDHQDCTAGETCSAGDCGGGTAVESCFDLSGSWRWRFDYPEYELFEDVESPVTLVQRDGYLMLFGESGSVGDSGPIDLSTGEFHLSGAPRSVKDLISPSMCVGGVDGQATSGGELIEGTNLVTAWGAAYCAIWTGQVTGSRCINGSLETAEQCDDGNVIAGDGCDPSCQVEPCFACSGLRSVCNPLRDGTTCDDANEETPRTVCHSGACAVPPPCAGDCNDDGVVIINELVMGVNIAFGRMPVADCSSIDTNGSGAVDIGELTLGVRKLLDGCAP
jgi:cysteine-rich repeat protein